MTPLHQTPNQDFNLENSIRLIFLTSIPNMFPRKTRYKIHASLGSKSRPWKNASNAHRSNVARSVEKKLRKKNKKKVTCELIISFFKNKNKKYELTYESPKIKKQNIYVNINVITENNPPGFLPCAPTMATVTAESTRLGRPYRGNVFRNFAAWPAWNTKEMSANVATWTCTN